jgi:thiol-disulfide isomerase/thioredoxin
MTGNADISMVESVATGARMTENRSSISRRRFVGVSAGLIAAAGCGFQRAADTGRVSNPSALQDPETSATVSSEPAVAKIDAARVGAPPSAVPEAEPSRMSAPEPVTRQATASVVSSPRTTVSELMASNIVRPRLKEAPDFRSTQWINSEPLSLASLRGTPFLVEFWTFACYNCKNVIPSMKAWYEELGPRGFEIVAIHSPEFNFEEVFDNVKTAVAEQGIRYPVAIDNDFGLWRAYGNKYWPTMYLVDAEGWIRYVHIGEGYYDETRQAIVDLILE